jgi:F-box and WD-40 domain protein 1/11
VEHKVAKVIDDHEDSVLCVRFDDVRLVSCSKGESLLEMLLLRLMPHPRPYCPNIPLPGS